MPSLLKLNWHNDRDFKSFTVEKRKKLQTISVQQEESELIQQILGKGDSKLMNENTLTGFL